MKSDIADLGKKKKINFWGYMLGYYLRLWGVFCLLDFFFRDVFEMVIKGFVEEVLDVLVCVVWFLDIVIYC